MMRRPCSSAWRSTKRVCGMGPSNASTMSRAPSAMFSTRSTSPPKSAWPGVSMTLIFTSLYTTEMFLDRMVMPRSRSWSLLSSTRSSTCWFSRNTPLAYNRRSTMVVLPWSTCAIMATLRMFSCFMPFFFFLFKPCLNRRGDDPYDGACGGYRSRRGRLSPERCVFRLNSARFGRQGRRCRAIGTIRRGDRRRSTAVTRRPTPRRGGALPC